MDIYKIKRSDLKKLYQSKNAELENNTISTSLSSDNLLPATVLLYQVYLETANLNKTHTNCKEAASYNLSRDYL